MSDSDLVFMQDSLHLAQQAMEHNEVPVGAVCVLGDKIISRGMNQTITQCNPCAHAEVLALHQAAVVQKNHRLPEITLYVTLEPCLMCVGAMLQARIKRLVYGCKDKRFGVFSKQDLFKVYPSNHQFEVVSGVLYEESGALLRQFFKAKRGKQA